MEKIIIASGLRERLLRSLSGYAGSDRSALAAYLVRIGNFAEEDFGYRKGELDKVEIPIGTHSKICCLIGVGNYQRFSVVERTGDSKATIQIRLVGNDVNIMELAERYFSDEKVVSVTASKD